jgi:mRNA degradation ribonuclease J1/J2
MLPEELDNVMGSLNDRIYKTVSKSNGNLEKAVLQSLKSYFYQETKRSPFIFVTVNQS